MINGWAILGIWFIIEFLLSLCVYEYGHKKNKDIPMQYALKGFVGALLIYFFI